MLSAQDAEFVPMYFAKSMYQHGDILESRGVCHAPIAREKGYFHYARICLRLNMLNPHCIPQLMFVTQICRRLTETILEQPSSSVVEGLLAVNTFPSVA